MCLFSATHQCEERKEDERQEDETEELVLRVTE